MTLDLDHDDSSKKEIVKRVPSSVLPDEITQELEALSKVDDDRSSRIAKLEKLRRGEDVLPDGEEDVKETEEEMRSKQIAQPESTESSVEGE